MFGAEAYRGRNLQSISFPISGGKVSSRTTLSYFKRALFAQDGARDRGRDKATDTQRQAPFLPSFLPPLFPFLCFFFLFAPSAGLEDSGHLSDHCLAALPDVRGVLRHECVQGALVDYGVERAVLVPARPTNIPTDMHTDETEDRQTYRQNVRQTDIRTDTPTDR